jgi:predicted NBD/HSP70 family sugar kinase
VTPEFINVKSSIINKAILTAKQNIVGEVSVPVVSRDGLVALKLNRGEYMDLADIQSILRNGKVNVSGYDLSIEQKQMLEEIEKKNNNA